MPSRTRDNLSTYRKKRDPSATPEPFGSSAITDAVTPGHVFVVQQHQARALHWDFRLEIDGALRSWAVPKGPSANPQDKRFAALTEDHPLDYADFEGRIPDGNYGAGYVIVWDAGTYVELNDFAAGFEQGKLLFDLHGHKLHGRWTLVRMKGKGTEWLLIKERDQWASEVPLANDSIHSGLTLAQMAEPKKVEQRLRARLKRQRPAPPQRTAQTIAPMLAKPGEAFSRPGWLFEIKYDGYRMLIEKDGGDVVLRSRNGHDLSANFPELTASAARLPYSQLVVDGEVVVHNERGVPSFSLLQQRARLRGPAAIALAAKHQPVTYYAFDLPQALGFDLCETPLTRRKSLLHSVLPSSGPIRYSEHIEKDGLDTYAAVTKLGLEGVVAKRADSRYRSGRSDDWVKIRTRKSADFVIAGWLASKSNADDLGSLAVAEYRNDTLVFCGRVGSGLGAATRRELFEQIHALDPADPLVDGDRYHWVEPELVCEVEFKEYTRDGLLRQPIFIRLRDDKPPRECVSNYDDPNPEPLIVEAEAHEVLVSNREKIFFPEKNYTKGDLIDYYEAVSPWMLPYLKDRPLVLTRFPDGIHGKSFYQRDAPEFVPDWVKRKTLWSESAEREVNYFIANDAASLQYLANLGTIPIHAWHSRISNLEHPDWCVLDLDPKDAPFANVITTAKLIRDLLEELALPGFLKTSGASGLHILIPIAQRLTHNQSKTLGELLARVIVARRTDICTITRAVRKRDKKVYIDYLQNGHGQLLVAPLSARAEPAASVSMPIKWSELTGRLNNKNYHLKNAVARLKRAGDPMRGVLTTDVDLESALSKLAVLLA